MICDNCNGTGEVEEKKVSEGKHKDKDGNPLPCCNPKLKRPSQKYTLHAEYMLNEYGISAEEYDRISKSDEDFPARF